MLDAYAERSIPRSRQDASEHRRPGIFLGSRGAIGSRDSKLRPGQALDLGRVDVKAGEAARGPTDEEAAEMERAMEEMAEDAAADKD